MPKKVHVCPNLLIYLRVCRKLSLDEIASTVGMSFVSVRDRCLKLGLTKENIGKRPPKRSRRARVVNRDFTELELIAYEVGVRRGQTVKQIAEEHCREQEFVKEKVEAIKNDLGSFAGRLSGSNAGHRG